ncbi:MAG: LTA synthase family protein [Clostridia bacterium]|nr:LTA synthase family protein [Clostridia bacterium]
MKTVKRVFSFLKRALDNHPLLFFVVLSVFENFMIESLSRHSLQAGINHVISSPVVFFYNSLIIMMTLSFALLFRRRLFGVVLLSLPWIICGVVNSIVLSYRVTPLGAIDFQIVKLSLIFMYLTQWQRILLYIAVGVGILAIIALWILGPKISGKIHYGKNAASIVGLIVAVAVASSVAHNIKAISSDFGNLVGAYNNYGFVYCFSSSMLDTGIKKPDGYGEDATQTILSQFPQTNNTDELVKPDIVLIQLESFVDPKTIRDMTFSDDPAPIHTYLKENFSTGYLSVPSFGGGTANTEFEVLTGINLDNFGPGEYPYKTVMLKETTESIAYNLKENGYTAHAIHNHTGNFYDRDKVYPRMGFDSFQSKEYMYGFETTPYGWCKDKVLTEEIMTALTYTDEENGITEENPRFVWTVSVQGHGAYPTEPVAGSDNVIKIASEKYNEKELCALEYFINQVWEMDMFLGSLISALENRERPTLVIAYGDHLPSIGLESEDLTTDDAYLTEYVTWNNFGLPKVDKDLRTYELSSEILSQLGFNNGNLTKLHQYRRSENSPLNEEAYQEQIAYLAYDMLYGENTQFGGEKPYKKQDMRMGTLPITAESIKVMGKNLYVQGEGFTEKSKIFLNGEKLNTTMLSQYSLMATEVRIKEGDKITVGQSSSKREVLSYSDPIIYSESEHLVINTPEEAPEGETESTKKDNE